MTSQTLSPENTGEIRHPAHLVAEGETTDLTRFYAAPPQSPLPRPEAETAVLTLPDMPPRTAVFLGQGFEPDTAPPHPIPQPVPAGPHPRMDKTLVPLLRDRGEQYSDSRARRGLTPLARPVRYQGRHRQGGAR